MSEKHRFGEWKTTKGQRHTKLVDWYRVSKGNKRDRPRASRRESENGVRTLAGGGVCKGGSPIFSTWSGRGRYLFEGFFQESIFRVGMCTKDEAEQEASTLDA